MGGLSLAFAAACGLLLATISPYVYKAFVEYYSSNPEAMASELFEEFWQWRLKDSPEFATMVGYHGYDHLLESYSIKSFQDRKEKVQYFLKKTKELLPKLKDQWSQASLNILIDGLDGYLRGLDTHGHLYPISFIEGVHVDIFQTVDYMVFNTVEDYKKLLSRYEKLPKQDYESIDENVCYCREETVKEMIAEVQDEDQISSDEFDDNVASAVVSPDRSAKEAIELL
ncbi:hypothetical protein HPB51_008431 [Rhipicephalus microplus]|uniref:Uncharacterized protein n=1 Tax=Rhipicephalus microplus TaxID=6941 RepID=A0A9J6EGI0_RHIMP|nr:hypothetical protein HPB51_008431 [Rhipicephalus microplus]